LEIKTNEREETRRGARQKHGRLLGDEDMIYLLTAIGLSPGGSTHIQTDNT